MSTIARYWHTLRWLKPVQVYGRARFRWWRPLPDRRPAPFMRAGSGWAACARDASMTGPGTFRFLGVERTLGRAGDWNRPDWPKLWLYNAHYFDDLLAEGASTRTDWHQALLRRWVAENPPGRGNGWEPYPTSLRIVNWVKWHLAGNHLEDAMRQSLAVQVRWLRRRLEHHLQGNHLWANAKALVFAGACFEGKEADGWLRQGLALMRREVRGQILPDGGHYERSPMYHAVMNEDLLDLLQLAARTGRLPQEACDEWREVARRMLDWAATLAHPDGLPAFFNDAAFGIAPDLPALAGYARALGLAEPQPPAAGMHVLPASGYARLQTGAAVVLADVGPVGPDHLPGHAHADTLSFEMSLHGRRVLVNGGTSTYQNDAERARQRGTAAHNTVVVDGHDSSEVWSAFRVARRARVHDLAWSETGPGLELAASHDGYRRLPGRVTHHRSWRLDASGLEVADTLTGEWREAVARFHFAPGEILEYGVEGGTARVVRGTWHPRFGESVAVDVLVVELQQANCRVRFRWS